LRKAEVRVVEAHPVGVVEDRRAFEQGREAFRAIEVERVRVDPTSKRITAVRRIRERANAVAGVE
jgi:hypothetical protein